jgi:hypothetical protein
MQYHPYDSQDENPVLEVSGGWKRIKFVLIAVSVLLGFIFVALYFNVFPLGAITVILTGVIISIIVALRFLNNCVRWVFMYRREETLKEFLSRQ